MITNSQKRNNVPPLFHNLQEMVLCGLMQAGHSYQVDYLSVDDFTGMHVRLFEKIKALHQEGRSFDGVSLIDALGDAEHLNLLLTHKNTMARYNLSELINALKTEHLRLEIMKALASKENFTPNHIFDAIAEQKAKMLLLPGEAIKAITMSHESFREYLVNARSQDMNYLGWQTFLPSIDNLASGLCNTHLIVVAARPSVGKSALGLFLASRVLMQNGHVLFWSTEMDERIILGRLYSQFLKINASHLTNFPKMLKDEDLKRLDDEKEKFSRLFVETGFGAHVHEIYDKALILKKQGKLDMVVVDYIQNLSGVGDTLVEKLGYISNYLKKMAMELNVPVITLAQLNRQAQHMNVPSMAEIKGSGTIEQDADIIFLLHHNENEAPDKYWLITAKNRHGETKNIPIIFNKPYQLFLEDGAPGRILGKKDKAAFEL